MATLNSFFVYNSNYGPREGEEIKKVLYYFPPSADENTQCKDIGLAEAIVKFVETFTSKPCRTIHTQKARHVLYEAEPDFWMVMKVNIPHSTKTVDGGVSEEYHEEVVNDDVFCSLLRQAYDMFKLFMGSFGTILCKADGDVDRLKQRLEHFYGLYLTHLRLSQSDILDVYNGISWLPLDVSLYLRIQCLINRLESKYSEITYTTFLLSDYLVWTGIALNDMRIIYSYLTSTLIPAYHEQELTSPSNSRRKFSENNFGQFITGVASNPADATTTKMPRVYITKDGECKEYHLLVYRALNVTLCCFINGSVNVTSEFCRRFDADLGPTLTELASDLMQKESQRFISGDAPLKYIYFNQMNLATKTTVHIDTRKTRLVCVPAEILIVIADIHSDLKRYSRDCECLVKTISGYWVVCKKSDSREIFVVVCDKNGTLTSINEEAWKLCNMQFANLFHIS